MYIKSILFMYTLKLLFHLNMKVQDVDVFVDSL